jgi:hypothetical protein
MSARDALRGWSARRPGQSRSLSATQVAIGAAVLAVMAGAFFEVRPPEAYGICMACHDRDLINWLLNAAAGMRLTVAPASAILPLLTGAGAVIGAFAAAQAHGEARWSMPEHPLKGFIYGVLVMNFALLAAGCSIRLLLRAAAGDLAGLVGVVGMAAGIILATRWLTWRARQ